MTETEMKKIMLQPNWKVDRLSIVIERIFTDVNGTILDKNTVPASLQVEYPLYVFNEFDRQGAYYLALKNTPPKPGYEYLCNFIYSVNNPFFFGFSGVSDIQRKLKPGDLCLLYTDSVLNPTYFIWIVQRTPNRSIGSIMNNLCNLPVEPKYGYLHVSEFDYYTENVNQWNQDIQVIHANYLGLIHSNNAAPGIYRLPKTFDNGFVQVKSRFLLNQYIGLNMYILFDTDSMNFNFKLLMQNNENN